ncbi:MAG: hypothetical protein AAF748_00250 [Pseudomonadota bacterium]
MAHASHDFAYETFLLAPHRTNAAITTRTELAFVQDVTSAFSAGSPLVVFQRVRGDGSDVPLTPRDLPPDIPTPGAFRLPLPSPLERLAITDGGISPDPSLDGPLPASCAISGSAVEQPASMVLFELSAPCNAGQLLTVQHGGMVFTATLDGSGVLAVEIPALASNVTISARLQDGSVFQASTRLDLPMPAYRVVLQYNGVTGLQLHALEFGATYGDIGHVWAENPRDPVSADRVGGGFLTRLGAMDQSGAFMAEVYTLPTRPAGAEVRLSVEAEVSDANCSRDIAGQVLQPDENGVYRQASLTASVPGCDALGEYLIFDGMLDDLR